MKQIIIFCISILITFPLSACERDKSIRILEYYIINPDRIMLVQFFNNTDGNQYKVMNDDIKTIIDILNTAQYDNERNDGRMFKMEVPSFEIEVQYSDDSEVNVKLWDNTMYVNQTWYQLDIKNIKEIFSKYKETKIF